MKFRAKAPELRQVVSELKAIARPRGKNDIPKIALELTDSKLHMRACDMGGSYYTERELTVEGEENGRCILEIQNLDKIVSAQRGMLNFDIPESSNGTVTTGRTNLTLLVYDDPVNKLAPESDNWYYFSEAGPVIGAVARANRNRDDTEDTRFAVNGICMQNHNNRLEVVGMNDSGLVAIATELTYDGDQVVCQADFAKILGTYDKSKSLELCVEPNGVWIRQYDRLDWVGRILNRRFPFYHNAIEHEPDMNGTLELDQLTQLKSVLRQGVIDPDSRGLLRLHGSDDALLISGGNKKDIQAISIPNFKLPPIWVEAKSLAALINMFNGDVDVTSSLKKNKTHLYFRQGDQFGLLPIIQHEEN